MTDFTDNLRILIVADDPLARAGLGMLLTDLPDCTVVGQVAGQVDLLSELDIYRPDVLIWDLGWNPALALARLTDLKAAKVPVVALLPDESEAAGVWGTGALGLLFRTVTPDKLLAALQAVAQGLAVLEPELVAPLLPHTSPEPPPLVEALTPRESEVLHLLAEGLPNKAIARRLEISDHTVKFHVNAIMGKLGVLSRTEAVVRATRLRLILL